jgi:hypothetical protein
MTGIVVDSARPAVEWVTSLPLEWRVIESERLVLLCLACDAFRWESAPGYEAIAEWTGMQRTSCIRILGRLCEETEHRPALLERVSVGGRRRTIWRLLGDREPVDGVDRFTAPQRRPQPSPNRSATSTGSDPDTAPEPVGHVDRLGDGSNRSATSTGCDANRRPTDTEPSPNRSATSTAPFALSPNPKPNPKPSLAADADETAQDAPEDDPMRPPQDEALDLGISIPDPPAPNPVQVLVAAYADRVRGRASKSLLASIGRNAKRLIETDGFDPALILAAIEEAAPHGRRDLDRIIAAPGGPAVRFERTEARRAMFAHWAATAARIDARRAS